MTWAAVHPKHHHDRQKNGGKKPTVTPGLVNRDGREKMEMLTSAGPVDRGAKRTNVTPVASKVCGMWAEPTFACKFSHLLAISRRKSGLFSFWPTFQ